MFTSNLTEIYKRNLIPLPFGSRYHFSALVVCLTSLTISALRICCQIKRYLLGLFILLGEITYMYFAQECKG